VLSPYKTTIGVLVMDFISIRYWIGLGKKKLDDPRMSSEDSF
jgi:hypothetical protein